MEHKPMTWGVWGNAQTQLSENKSKDNVKDSKEDIKDEVRLKDGLKDDVKNVKDGQEVLAPKKRGRKPSTL